VKAFQSIAIVFCFFGGGSPNLSDLCLRSVPGNAVTGEVKIKPKNHCTIIPTYQYSDLQEDLLGLLWAMEEAHVYGLAENMPLDRFHYV
jgi:hypothetical protein